MGTLPRQIQSVLRRRALVRADKGLCAVLEISHVGNVAAWLDEKNIQQADVQSSRGQKRQTLMIDESGMYVVVIRPDKPEAATLRRWITFEVLPAIPRRAATVLRLSGTGAATKVAFLMRVANPATAPQHFDYVSEADTYSLVLRSRKPEAKAFKRTVLRALRRSVCSSAT